jgi:hypothetical protein
LLALGAFVRQFIGLPFHSFLLAGNRVDALISPRRLRTFGNIGISFAMVSLSRQIRCAPRALRMHDIASASHN